MPLLPTSGPYPGLRAFKPDEANVFFGRDEQIDELVERLATQKLLAVVGESGCGKSSLVRAGLIPALTGRYRGTPGTPWTIATLRPGNQPMRELSAALLRALLQREPLKEEVSLLLPLLTRGPLGINEALNSAQYRPPGQLLIFVDQFEELIRFRRNVDANEADAFVALLLAASASTLDVRIILTLRTDYLGKCSVFRGLPEALTRSQYLTPLLNREQLHEAITFPARLFGGDVDEALANEIVNEVGKNQDQLPVVQHALMWMWTRAARRSLLPEPLAEEEPVEGTTPVPVAAGASRPPAQIADSEILHSSATPAGPILTLESYRAVGGLGSALSKHADELFNCLSPEQQKIARGLFCALWEDDPKTKDNRRPCRVEEAAAIVGVPAPALMVVADTFRATEHCFVMPSSSDQALDETTVLDVSHESLFRHWTRLHAWLVQESKDADEFRDWRNRAVGNRGGRLGLLSPGDLKALVDWRTRVQPTPAWAAKYQREPGDFAAITSLIDASEIDSKKRTKQKWAWRAFNGALIAGTIGYGVHYLASRSDQAQAKESARLSEARASADRFAAAAANATSKEPARALQLALEVVQTARDTPDVQRVKTSSTLKDIPSRGVLREALRRSRFRSLIVPSMGFFFDARILPGSERVLTVGQADGLGIWSLADGKRIAGLFGREPSPTCLAVSPDGHRAFVAGSTGVVDIWDVDGRKLLASMEGHADEIGDMAVSPDGSLLASASIDGSARIWLTGSAMLKHTLWGHLASVTSVAFSHDGKRLATGGKDKRVIIWDVRSGSKLRSFNAREDIEHLAFSANGEALALVGDEIRLWDPATSRPLGTLEPTNGVTEIAFGPDGETLASVGTDSFLRVWDTHSRRRLSEAFDEPALGDPETQRVLPIRMAAISEPAPSATNHSLPAQSASRAPQRAPGSSAPSGPDPRADLRATLDSVSRLGLRSVALSQDGDLAITTGFDGLVKVWSVFDQEELPASRGHRDDITGFVFSPNGNQAASAGADGALVLWDWRQAAGAAHLPMLRRVARTSEGRAQALSFSADGKSLFTSERETLDISTKNRIVAWRLENAAITRDWTLEVGAERIRVIKLFGSSESPRIAVAAGHEAVVYDLKTRNQLFRLNAATSLYALAISRDSTLLATECREEANDEHVRICIWDAQSGKRTAVIRGGASASAEDAEVHLLGIRALAFSPNGQLLVSGGKDKVAKIWDVGSRTLRGRLVGHSGAVLDAAVSPDSKRIATAGSDSVRMWDVDGSPARDFPSAEPGSQAVAFSADGRYLVVAGSDGILRPYPTDPAELVSLATNRVPLPLSSQDCDRYAGAVCLVERTAHQHNNVERLALRGSRVAHARGTPQLEKGELRRYQAAKLVDRAFGDIIAAMKDAIIYASDAMPKGGDPVVAAEGFASAYGVKLKATAGVGVTLLQQAKQLDPELPADAEAWGSRIATARLLAHTRQLAQIGGFGVVTPLLGLMTKKTTDVAEQASTDMKWSGLVQGVNNALNDEKHEEAIKIVSGFAPSSGDPRRALWLRLGARAYAHASSPDDLELFHQLVTKTIETAKDADALVEVAKLLDMDKDLRAQRALQRAYALSPRDDETKFWLGLVNLGKPAKRQEGVDLLADVSRDYPDYTGGLALAGAVAFDQLGQRERGYSLIAMTAEGRSPDGWANLAEAALAMGSATEARLLAQRVIEARMVDRAKPRVQVAMLMVVTASFVLAGEMDGAQEGLNALTALVESDASDGSWSYAGSRAGVRRNTTGARAAFLLALIDYCETAGKVGSRAQLDALLRASNLN